MEKQYGKYNFVLTGAMRNVVKNLKKVIGRPGGPKDKSSNEIIPYVLKYGEENIRAVVDDRRKYVHYMTEYRCVSSEIHFMKTSRLVLVPESMDLIKALTKSAYNNLDINMVQPPKDSFIVLFPKEFTLVGGVLVSFMGNRKRMQLYGRETFKQIKKIDSSVSINDYLDDVLLNHSKDSEDELTMEITAYVADKYTTTKNIAQTELVSILKGEIDHSKQMESIIPNMPKPEELIPDKDLQAIVKLILGMCLYLQARPDKLVDLASPNILQFPKMSNLPKNNICTLKEPEEMSTESHNDRAIHWRTGHPRFLYNEKFRRNQDGSIRMTWVQGHMVGVKAEEKLVKDAGTEEILEAVAI